MSHQFNVNRLLNAFEEWHLSCLRDTRILLIKIKRKEEIKNS